MKTPFLADDAFLADVAQIRSSALSLVRSPHLHLWWLGQSGYLVHYRDAFLLLDPYLSDSLTRKYAATDKPHVRITGRVVDPARLEGIAAVTSSHNHTDHLDPETLQALVRANPGLRMLCPEANRSTVRERSGLPDDRILGFDVPAGAGPDDRRSPSSPASPRIDEPPSQPVPGTPFSVVPIPAAHETLERDARGRLVYLGFVVQAGPFRIYHAGDTLLFEGMEEWLRPFAVDVALLPINGRAPERRVAGNLRGREAAQLARDIGARLAVPCHYDMFEFNTASPREFTETCQALRQPFQVLEQGQRLTLTPAP